MLDIMLELFDGWKFLAGLGIFLFGMFMMEESIKLLAGRSFKTLIRRFTGTRSKALTTGIVSTAILQSSSAVSLMVLAFVGAGLMSLVNAIAVIMGAKLGTTCTAWIVAVVGFSFKIDTFALPMIGIGGLGLILLAKSARWVNVSKLLVAFGFLFHGLDYMKSSVEVFAASVDLAILPELGLWVYVLAGILLTAVMQSSSATIAIILTTLFAGIIDFQQGAGMVIGANVGTTVTILLGAIGGIPVKKQTAASSLAFSMGTALVVLLTMPVLIWIIDDLFALEHNAVLGIALFHTLFNFIGVLVFFPLIPPLARILAGFFPEKRTVLSRFILNTTPQVPEAAIAALRNEILQQLIVSIRFIGAQYRLRPGPNGAQPHDPSPTYEDLENYHAEIFTFYAKIQAQALHEYEALQLEPVIRASRSIMNATRNFHELAPELEELTRTDNTFLDAVHRELRTRLELLWIIVEKVAQETEKDLQKDELRRFFNSIEESDRQFILSCSAQAVQGTIKEYEVTKVLMINRFFTQSSRMLVLSMQALVDKNTPLATPAETAATLSR
jgi:phosphate:Na+ symporter